MAITSAARRRLAALMDERRAELRLRWRDVADLGGLSYEVIRAVRNGTGEIRLLTQRGIEDGLKWQQGSIQAILSGGDPVPVPDAPPADDERNAWLGLPPDMTAEERRTVLNYIEVKRAAERRGA
jgi:hypothetical protein